MIGELGHVNWDGICLFHPSAHLCDHGWTGTSEFIALSLTNLSLQVPDNYILPMNISFFEMLLLPVNSHGNKFWLGRNRLIFVVLFIFLDF